MQRVRTAYYWLLVLALAGVVTQFILAGLGIFGETGFGAHETLGIILHIPVAALLLILALIAIRPMPLLGMAAAFSVLLFLQPFWVPQGETRWIGALHVVLPVALLGLGFALARRLKPLIRTPAAA